MVKDLGYLLLLLLLLLWNRPELIERNQVRPKGSTHTSKIEYVRVFFCEFIGKLRDWMPRVANEGKKNPLVDGRSIDNRYYIPDMAIS